MTKEDNAAYASRSGLVLMAGDQLVQAKDAARTSARAADKAGSPELTFVDDVSKSIEAYCDGEYDPNSSTAVY